MKRILIIEDDLNTQDTVSDILELNGYQTECVENGKEGIEKALENKPDLVVCDIIMPILDGFETLESFKKSDELSKIPFIFLSALLEESDFRKAKNLGACDYVTKPFNPSDLLACIDKKLSNPQGCQLKK